MNALRAVDMGGSDRQSPDQKEIEKDIKDVGGIYFVAKTYSGYVETISTYFNYENITG